MTRNLPPIHAGDSLVVAVTVADGAAPLDLAGASVTARLRGETGAVLPLQVAVEDAAAGRFVISLAAGAVTAGRWRLQARVALPNGEAQTVTDATLTAERSIF